MKNDTEGPVAVIVKATDCMKNIFLTVSAKFELTPADIYDCLEQFMDEFKKDPNEFFKSMVEAKTNRH